MWVAASAVLNEGARYQLWIHVAAGAAITGSGLLLLRQRQWDGRVAAILGGWLLIAGLTPGGHERLPVVWINLPAGILVTGAVIVAALRIRMPWT